MIHGKHYLLLRLAALLTFFQATSCSDEKLIERTSEVNIIGGENTYVKEPYVVKLTIGSSSCTGSFIRRRLIMTAAHCIAKHLKSIEGTDNSFNLRVDISKPNGVNHPIYLSEIKGPFMVGHNIFVNSSFMRTALPADEDDGILSLEEQGLDVAFIITSSRSEPFDGPLGKLAPYAPGVGDPVKFVGYGLTDPNSGIRSRRIGSNRVAYINSRFGVITTIGAPSEEAFQKNPLMGSSTAKGDSGGPLLDKYGRIAGIVSSGNLRSDGDHATFFDINGPERDFVQITLKGYDKWNSE